MKRNQLLIVSTIIVVFLVVVTIALTKDKVRKVENDRPVAPGQACLTSADCQLPMDYAIRSNCPYTSVCRTGSCAVACPLYEYSPDVAHSVSYDVSCESNDDCDCGAWDIDGTHPCECLDSQCVSVVE